MRNRQVFSPTRSVSSSFDFMRVKFVKHRCEVKTERKVFRFDRSFLPSSLLIESDFGTSGSRLAISTFDEERVNRERNKSRR